MIHGSPGIGKTELCEEAAGILSKLPEISKRKARVLFDFISAPLLDPTDTKGLPALDPEKLVCRWLKPAFLPVEDPNGPPVYMILLIDELTSAPPSTQASLLTLIHKRKVQDYTLPDGVFIIAAGNRVSDRSYSIPLSSAMCSRFIHISLDPDFESWKTWAYKSGIDHHVIGFLNFRNGQPGIFNTTKYDEYAYPCPRTWEMVSNLMQKRSKLSESQFAALVTGAVGTGAGQEFLAFLELEEIPDIDKLLLDPDKAPIPVKPDAKFAIISALAQRARDESNFGPIIQYLMRLDGEFAIMGAREVAKANRDILLTKDKNGKMYIKPFMDKYGKLISHGEKSPWS
jgi:hypothetical protein